MKKYIFLLAILFNQFIQINAQTNDSTSKSSFGINTSFIAEGSDNGGIFFSPTLVYNYNHQTFIIGPAFSLDDAYSGYGLEFTYKIITNPGKVFNFFFFNHFTFHYLYRNQTSYFEVYPANGTYTIESGNYWDKDYQFNDEIGYGFNLKIFKGLYLNQYIGIGISNEKQEQGFNDNTNPSNSYVNHGSYELNASLFVNLGIGYNFGSKK
jgi:hypothetical protein